MARGKSNPARQFSFPDRTLRKRVARASVLLALVLVALSVVLILSLVTFRSRGDDVIERWQPADSLSQTILGDLVNQETGVRGYALGGRPALLAPYIHYRAVERVQEARLRGLLEGHVELENRLDAVVDAGNMWRTNVAQQYIRRVRAGDPTVDVAARSDQAKAAFDRIRRASASLTAGIAVERKRANDARATAMIFVWSAVGVLVGVTLLAGLIVWRALRTAVLDPVEALAAQTRLVARGEIDREIVGTGPPEIKALGSDVDSMRARIASELESVERARAALAARSEDLARSNADLEQFAYVASHDLSEPLRKVANFCQLLERQYNDQLDDRARQYIAFAVDGAKRMQVLIGDLLAFSRVGRTTERFEPVDTTTAVARAISLLDHRITETGARIDYDRLPVVPGDPTLLTALFQNLIANAVKYHDPDVPPRVQISAHRDGNVWLFTIKDNGIGIDPQYAERIFTIFQRLHLRDQYGGTGIGLALCRRIVEFHRGKIWLAESAGPGATFQFTIPSEVDQRETVITSDDH
jgi:signal transduction histidine kinase